MGKKLMVGNRLTFNKEDIRGGGTDHYVNLNDLRAMSNRLATVTAAPKRMNDRVVQVESLIKRSLTLPTAKDAPYSGEWGRVDCFDFDTIYTDGSWKERASMKDFLSGKREIIAGGAVVLRKGDKYFPIYVEMDIELDSAFEAELISLLIAISMALDMEVER